MSNKKIQESEEGCFIPGIGENRPRPRPLRNSFFSFVPNHFAMKNVEKTYGSNYKCADPMDTKSDSVTLDSEIGARSLFEESSVCQSAPKLIGHVRQDLVKRTNTEWPVGTEGGSFIPGIGETTKPQPRILRNVSFFSYIPDPLTKKSVTLPSEEINEQSSKQFE